VFDWGSENGIEIILSFMFGKTLTSSVQVSFIFVKVFLENLDRLLRQLQQWLAIDQGILCSSQTTELQNSLDSIAGGLSKKVRIGRWPTTISEDLPLEPCFPV
jgi:hypothetical protein